MEPALSQLSQLYPASVHWRDRQQSLTAKEEGGVGFEVAAA